MNNRKLQNLTPWKTGQSGNPNGRQRPSHDVIALARNLTPIAINVLSRIMQNPNEPAGARVSAASIILDRGWGKPLQTLAAPDGNSPISLHLLATQFVGKQLLAERNEQPPPTIQHEPATNGAHVNILDEPPPSE